MQCAVQRLGHDGELPVPQRTVRVRRARLHVGGRLRLDADAARVVARHQPAEPGLLLVLLPDPSVHAWRLLRRSEGRADPGGRADVVALPRHGDLTELLANDPGGYGSDKVSCVAWNRSRTWRTCAAARLSSVCSRSFDARRSTPPSSEPSSASWVCSPA